MDIHRPKPWHGVREFLKEYAIVVVGVLTALAAEQAVEAWHWHEKVAVVRQSIMGELSNDRARWEIDATEARCVVEDIERMATWAQEEGSAKNSTAPPFRESGFFSMHSANWSLAVSSQTLDHFPLKQQLAFAALHDGIAHRDKDIDRAFILFDRVKILVPLATDARGKRDLRESLGALERDMFSLLSNVEYMKRHFDEVGVKADRGDFVRDIRAVGC